MADLTVTIAETATSLQGSQSISDETTLTIEGIISFYQFKGQAADDGSTHSIYSENNGSPSGIGDDKLTLAYLRITNLEASESTMALIIDGSTGDTCYLNLAVNESFIFCPKIGNNGHFQETDTGTAINASGYINQIYFENSTFEGKHYEIYAAFVAE